MASGSTMYNFEISLSDVDGGRYDTLTFTAARHPSESGPYLVARALALALEQREGIAFSNGLGSSEEPAVWAHDLTGQLTAWIEVGTPDKDRLHKASKASDDVAVYCHKDPAGWLRQLSGARVHNRERIRIYALPPDEVAQIAEALDRRNTWSLSRMDGTLYLDSAAQSWALPLTQLDWPA